MTAIPNEVMRQARVIRTVDANPFIPWTPTERQREFLACDSLEALYGGAAGGGKTAGLLMAALQYVEVTGYAALLLRRTFRELAMPGSLIDLSLQWLGPRQDCRWNGGDKTWTFPSGAVLRFGYLENDNDIWQYQSAEFQMIGFDEVTEFTERQYRFLFSRLRRPMGSIVPLRMRAGSNPGGRGHEWVMNRFPISSTADNTQERAFIPARLEDNPYLDQMQYEDSLKQLDPVLRARLREGDWSIRAEDGLFMRHWFQIVGDSPADAKRVRYWDMASTEPTSASDDPDYAVGVKMSEKDGIYYVEDVQRVRVTPGALEKLVAQCAHVDGPETLIGIEQEGGSAGKAIIDHYARNVLKGWAFRGYPSTGSKHTRAQPVAIAAEAGNVRLVQGNWIGPFLDELTVAEGHDDQMDALSGAFAMLNAESATVEIW